MISLEKVQTVLEETLNEYLVQLNSYKSEQISVKLAANLYEQTINTINQLLQQSK